MPEVFFGLQSAEALSFPSPSQNSFPGDGELLRVVGRLKSSSTKRMACKAKFLKNFRRQEPQKLGLRLLVGCLLVSTVILAISKYYIIPFNALSFWLTSHSTSGLLAGDGIGFHQHAGASNHLSKKASASNQVVGQPREHLCDFSGRRSNICEMDGDIRVDGNSSSIFFLAPWNENTSVTQESWRIKPHPRKGDTHILPRISEMSVRSLHAHEEAPDCTITHTVPAVIFSMGGYMGNVFHDFTDVLIPLYITSRHYNGEVQFLVSDMQPAWIEKYRPVLKQLTRREILDFKKAGIVRCYTQVTVGLRFHKEMSIDPDKDPKGHSMVDFARLLRRSFGLERERAIKLGAAANPEKKKPRLLLIARNSTRSFTNVDEIAKMARWMGFEVVVAEAGKGSNLTAFARLVNSCDVMMGVHGAGLTNLVFLPTNAVLIQVVPLGRLEGISFQDFGVASLDMNLRYLQYSISDEESTLVESYPRDHAVFKDPLSIQKRGWLALREVFLIKQNVKLNVARFRGVLVQALDLLHR